MAGLKGHPTRSGSGWCGRGRLRRTIRQLERAVAVAEPSDIRGMALIAGRLQKLVSQVDILEQRAAAAAATPVAAPPPEGITWAKPLRPLRRV